jgi:hypothetical protein
MEVVPGTTWGVGGTKNPGGIKTLHNREKVGFLWSRGGATKPVADKPAGGFLPRLRTDCPW